MKITAIELEEKDIFYILTDALESNAIGYWAQYQEWDRMPDVSIEGDDSLALCVKRMSIKELNDDETDYTISHEVDRNVIIKGVERIVKGDVDAPRIREMILNDDIDADGSDCIVQAGLFGEIKYG